MAGLEPVPAEARGANNIPRRRALVDEVRDLIARQFLLSGELGPGDLLPSEKELSQRYGVSRVTLRAGMRVLQERGLITSRHGVGWQVVDSSAGLVQGLDKLSSLETLAHEAGKELTTAELTCDELEADETVAARLEVTPGDRVLLIQRVKLLDEVPVAWLVDWVPDGVIPFQTLRNEFKGSVLDVLLAYPDVGLEYADTEIRPVALDRTIARRLQVKGGSAALFADSLVRTATGQVVEWAQAWLLGEHLRFYVRRRRPVGA